MTINKRHSTKSSSNRSWIVGHFNDKYVQQAQKKGLRSRAWFKLAEIQRKDNIFQPGMIVIDLGSAPGSWSKFVTTQIGSEGRVIACDILPMNSIIGVDFLQGDVSDPKVLQDIFKRIGNNHVQIVLSDMAPNMSGKAAIDMPRCIKLSKLALNMCRNVLSPGGSFIFKIFQGEDFNIYIKEVNSVFNKVKIRKPDASRTRSKEVYIVAKGYKI